MLERPNANVRTLQRDYELSVGAFRHFRFACLVILAMVLPVFVPPVAVAAPASPAEAPKEDLADHHKEEQTKQAFEKEAKAPKEGGDAVTISKTGPVRISSSLWCNFSGFKTASVCAEHIALANPDLVDRIRPESQQAKKRSA